MLIFEKIQFYSYMDNMYIKWKLNAFQIQICHKKELFCTKYFLKIGFSFFSLILKVKKNFECKFFEKMFLRPPNFIFKWIQTPKMENTWRFETPNIIAREIASHGTGNVLIPPTPTHFRVKFQWFTIQPKIMIRIKSLKARFVIMSLRGEICLPVIWIRGLSYIWADLLRF